MKHLNDYQKPKIKVANIYGEGIMAAMNAASQNTTSGDIHVYPNADRFPQIKLYPNNTEVFGTNNDDLSLTCRSKEYGLTAERIASCPIISTF